MAKSIITKEFELVSNSEEYEELAIDLMGGEPLLQFFLIRQIAEWLWSEPRPAPYILFSTTNGTVLTEEMKEWFTTHRNRYYLSLSLDGTGDMHELNRGCNLSDIDLQFFLLHWPEQQIKMTVSCDSLSSLADGVVYLQKVGFQVHANLGYGMPWGERHLEVLKVQLEKLGTYYLENDTPPSSLLALPIQNVTAPVGQYQRKYCGTGTKMNTYDVDGKAYPCHLFTPIVHGPSGSMALGEINFDDEATVHDPKCQKCILSNICPTCYGFNYKTTGDPAIRDVMMCRLFKIQGHMNAIFQGEKLRRKRQHEPLSHDDILLAKACLLIDANCR